MPLTKVTPAMSGTKQLVKRFLTEFLDDFSSPETTTGLNQLTLTNQLVIGKRYELFFRMAVYIDNNGSSTSMEFQDENFNRIVFANVGYQDSDFSNFSEHIGSDTHKVTFTAQGTDLIPVLNNVSQEAYIIGYGDTEGTYFEIKEADDVEEVANFT